MSPPDPLVLWKGTWACGWSLLLPLTGSLLCRCKPSREQRGATVLQLLVEAGGSTEASTSLPPPPRQRTAAAANPPQEKKSRNRKKQEHLESPRGTHAPLKFQRPVSDEGSGEDEAADPWRFVVVREWQEPHAVKGGKLSYLEGEPYLLLYTLRPFVLRSYAVQPTFPYLILAATLPLTVPLEPTHIAIDTHSGITAFYNTATGDVQLGRVSRDCSKGRGQGSIAWGPWEEAPQRYAVRGEVGKGWTAVDLKVSSKGRPRLTCFCSRTGAVALEPLLESTDPAASDRPQTVSSHSSALRGDSRAREKRKGALMVSLPLASCECVLFYHPLAPRPPPSDTRGTKYPLPRRLISDHVWSHVVAWKDGTWVLCYSSTEGAVLAFNVRAVVGDSGRQRLVASGLLEESARRIGTTEYVDERKQIEGFARREPLIPEGAGEGGAEGEECYEVMRIIDALRHAPFHGGTPYATNAAFTDPPAFRALLRSTAPPPAPSRHPWVPVVRTGPIPTPPPFRRLPRLRPRRSNPANPDPSLALVITPPSQAE